MRKTHFTAHRNSQYPLITYLTESNEHINDLIAFYGEGVLLTTVSIFGLFGNIMSIIVLTRSINGRASGGNHINIGLSVGGTSFSNLLRGLATFDALFLLVSWYFKSTSQQGQIRCDVALKATIICHFDGLSLVRPNKPNQLSSNLDPGGPTRTNTTQVLTLRAQPDPKLGSN